MYPWIQIIPFYLQRVIISLAFQDPSLQEWMCHTSGHQKRGYDSRKNFPPGLLLQSDCPTFSLWYKSGQINSHSPFVLSKNNAVSIFSKGYFYIGMESLGLHAKALSRARNISLYSDIGYGTDASCLLKNKITRPGFWVLRKIGLCNKNWIYPCSERFQRTSMFCIKKGYYPPSQLKHPKKPDWNIRCDLLQVYKKYINLLTLHR